MRRAAKSRLFLERGVKLGLSARRSEASRQEEGHRFRNHSCRFHLWRSSILHNACLTRGRRSRFFCFLPFHSLSFPTLLSSFLTLGDTSTYRSSIYPRCPEGCHCKRSHLRTCTRPGVVGSGAASSDPAVRATRNFVTQHLNFRGSGRPSKEAV